jgi:predicted O-methyltransferase YrrM
MTVTDGKAHGAGRFHGDARHLAQAGRALPFRRSPQLSDVIAAARAAATARPIGPATTNPCALQPETLRLIQSLLDAVRPTRIVEFGSGASTALFAGWAAAHGAELVSVEHDRGWVDRVGAGLGSAEQRVTSLRHAPLRLERAGFRTFLTYRGLAQLAEAIAAAQVVLVDGPHASGREPVIRAVLSRCAPGTIVLIDDCHHYAIREVLLGLDESAVRAFVGEELDEDAHGMCVLRCETPVGSIAPARPTPIGVLRSYWRCLRDFRHYGSGD